MFEHISLYHQNEEGEINNPVSVDRELLQQSHTGKFTTITCSHWHPNSSMSKISKFDS